MKKNEENISRCMQLAEQKRTIEKELCGRLATDAPHLSDMQLLDIHGIAETLTSGRSRWIARRAETLAVAWCLQREVLYYRRRLNSNLSRYLHGIMKVGKASTLKRDLLFLYLRQDDFATLCDECIEAIQQYIENETIAE